MRSESVLVVAGGNLFNNFGASSGAIPLAADTTAEVLIGGYQMGSLSMTSYTVAA